MRKRYIVAETDLTQTVQVTLPHEIRTRCGIRPRLCECEIQGGDKVAVIIRVEFSKTEYRDETIKHVIWNLGEYRDFDRLVQSVADRVAEIIKKESRKRSRKSSSRPGCRGFRHNGGRCRAGSYR